MKKTQSKDDAYDGYFLGRDQMLLPPERRSDILPLLPANGSQVQDHVYYINGIRTDVEKQFADMQVLADTGCAVIGIHVSTAGLTIDLSRCIEDKMHRGTSRAQEVLCSLILLHCRARCALHLVAHSRGALILSEALVQALQSFETASDALGLSTMSIETYGGASAYFPDGPRYVHIHNTLDPVSFFFGVGPASHYLYPPTATGIDAVVQDVTHLNWPSRQLVSRESLRESIARVIDHSVHGPQEIYFKLRQPFHLMYAGTPISMGATL